MESIVEFALFTWIVVSILAVLIQLIRMVRYRRAKPAPSAESATSVPATSMPATDIVDIEGRLAGQVEVEQVDTPLRAPDPVSAGATAGSSTMSAPPAPPVQPLPPEPRGTEPASAEQALPAEPPASEPPPMAETELTAAADIPDSSAATPDTADVLAVPETNNDASSSPALADLLAGVRLPWNLLPTVDQSRAPSDDRVVLITNEGEPSEIGADVADELERLGFSISTRGADTAIAARDGHSLGLQIIPEPMAASVSDTPRFPSATPGSVALDIWIES